MATSRCVQRKVDAGSPFAGSLFLYWRGGASTHGVDLPTFALAGGYPRMAWIYFPRHAWMGAIRAPRTCIALHCNKTAEKAGLK